MPVLLHLAHKKRACFYISLERRTVLHALERAFFMEHRLDLKDGWSGAA
jgi:hypothetical protein